MLIDKVFENAAWVASLARFTNTLGTVLVSSNPSGTGELISDIYTLAVSNVSSGTGTITVGTTALNNPYKGRQRSGVALDGVTVRTDIIPGVALVFSASAANGNTAQVKVGSFLGTFDAYGAGAGTPSTGIRHQVLNDGAGTVTGAVAKLLTQAIQFKKTGTVFAYIKPFADGATEKQQGVGS